MDGSQKFLCYRDRPFGILLGDVGSGTIIPYAAQFKQPIQVLAVSLVQFAGADELTMDESDDATVLAKRRSLIQQGGR